MSVVGDQRRVVLMPIVQIQSGIGCAIGGVLDIGSWRSYVAGPGVGAENLKAMREAFIGLKEQAFVRLIAGRFPYGYGATRTDGLRVVALCGREIAESPDPVRCCSD